MEHSAGEGDLADDFIVEGVVGAQSHQPDRFIFFGIMPESLAREDTAEAFPTVDHPRDSFGKAFQPPDNHRRVVLPPDRQPAQGIGINGWNNATVQRVIHQLKSEFLGALKSGEIVLGGGMANSCRQPRPLGPNATFQPPVGHRGALHEGRFGGVGGLEGVDPAVDNRLKDFGIFIRQDQ